MPAALAIQPARATTVAGTNDEPAAVQRSDNIDADSDLLRRGVDLFSPLQRRQHGYLGHGRNFLALALAEHEIINGHITAISLAPFRPKDKVHFLEVEIGRRVNLPDAGRHLDIMLRVLPIRFRL